MCPLFLNVAVQSRLTWGEADSKSWPSFSSLSEAAALRLWGMIWREMQSHGAHKGQSVSVHSGSLMEPLCFWNSDDSPVALTGSYNEKSNINWSFEITELDVHLLWLSEVKRLCIKKRLERAFTTFWHQTDECINESRWSNMDKAEKIILFINISRQTMGCFCLGVAPTALHSLANELERMVNVHYNKTNNAVCTLYEDYHIKYILK